MTEGPLYRFGQISFDGNTEFEDADLINRLSIESEGPFSSRRFNKLSRRFRISIVRRAITTWQFSTVRLRTLHKEIVDVTFNIQENFQRIFKDIEVEGNQKTSENLVRTQIVFEARRYRQL